MEKTTKSKFLQPHHFDSFSSPPVGLQCGFCLWLPTTVPLFFSCLLFSLILFMQECRWRGENRRKEHSTSQLFPATEIRWALETQGSANHTDAFSKWKFKHHFEGRLWKIFIPHFFKVFEKTSKNRARKYTLKGSVKMKGNIRPFLLYLVVQLLWLGTLSA